MKPNTIATFLAIAGLGLIIIITVLLFFLTSVPDKNLQTINIILGTGLGWVTSTFAFFFGNTTGNKTKDETIASLSATAATATTAPAVPQPQPIPPTGVKKP